MINCLNVDPEFHNQYYNTVGEANTERLVRLEHFLDRHHLWDQFNAEDIQGKR